MGIGSNSRKHLKSIGESILFWTAAFISYGIFRFYGIEQDIGFVPEQDLAETPFLTPLIILGVFGFCMGLLYAVFDLLFAKLISNRISLGLDILLKTITYFMGTIGIITSGLNFYSDIYTIMNFDLTPGWWLTDKRFWGFIYYIVIASILFSLLKIATERFGKGTFLKILLGKYKNPREENRIFMFLDLKDSTAIAEQIGHFKYSQFIQDCFYDLNKIVPKYDAEIYQYVGDEAVLSWPYEKGLDNNNCINLFFAFERQRQSNESYYIGKYGVFPEFKAGLHGGQLMVAEVGFVKKELAYHGDVINTSARIQGECKKYNVPLLLSEKLWHDLDIEKSSSSKPLGAISLKGKQEKVHIHSLTGHP
ncbi:MAG: adenylate/guanylate cyclase domain-containing protein [Bacteroidota bacterium]